MPDTLPILYNCTYGGFQFSKRAVEEYNKRKDTSEPDLDSTYHLEFDRTNSLMVQIVSELGDEASSQFAKIKLAHIPSRFEHHFKIEEYDGLESVIILYDKYAVDKIREILSDDKLTSESKVYHCKLIAEQNTSDRDEFQLE